MANYLAVITSNALAVSSNKGTPSVKLQVKTETCLDDNTPVEKTFYADLWLSENAKTRTFETLRAIGFAGNDISELNTPCLVGYEVEVSTSWDLYNGQERERIDFVNEVGSYASRGIKSIDDAAAKRLAASLNASLRNAKNVGKAHIAPGHTAPASAATPAPAAQGARPAAPMAGDDDRLPWE